VMKLFTKIICGIISEQIPIMEEQQGFRKNRSTTDAIFIIREINQPAYMCFIDLSKAFDRVRLNDITTILRRGNITEEIVKTIENLNTNTTTRILVNNSLTQKVPISTGIRQRDSLSPVLFGDGYRTNKGEITVLCYADDAVIISENEDEQRLLHQFYLTAKRYNMSIAINKTKSLVVAKEPRRCKLVVIDKIVEQVLQISRGRNNRSSRQEI